MFSRNIFNNFLKLTLNSKSQIFSQTSVIANKFRNINFVFFELKREAHMMNTVYNMSKVYVMHLPDSEVVDISFHYVNEDFKMDREMNLRRKLNEKIEMAVSRIKNNITKEIQTRLKKRKNKKSKSPEPPSTPIPEIEVAFFCADESNISEYTFEDLLKKNNSIAPLNIQLCILNKTFDVVINSPWVEKMTLPSSLLSGFTVYPNKLQIKFGDNDNSTGAWFKRKQPSSGDKQKDTNWIHCGDGLLYKPNNDDVDFYLKFVLTPGDANGRFGPPVEIESKTKVQAGPGFCTFDTRHFFTEQRIKDDKSLRVVSYNILADLYADSDYSRKNLFPYCPAYALSIDYRKQLLLKEVIGYNADIMCLQEVDAKFFRNDLQFFFNISKTNYEGVFTEKGTSSEGVALFFCNKKFEKIAVEECELGKNIPIHPPFNELYLKIKNNTKLLERICERSTTLQVSLLKCLNINEYLLVANTHLYFHPDADHIRLLQIGFIMLFIEDMYKRTLEKFSLNGKQLSIIFCGDFNTVPDCGIFKFMTERFVGSDSIDWKSNAEEAVKDVELSQEFQFGSACGTPKYTNYTPLFAECLDYIFIQSDRFEVSQIIPLPSDEELQEHVGIPSVVLPSDHVALIADLKFKEIQ